MRRLAAFTTVFVLAATTATIAAGASPSSAAATRGVTPGSIWTLQSGTSCQSESFAPHHVFAAAGHDGTGDHGTYKGTKALTMTWKAGSDAGAVFAGTWQAASKNYAGTYTQAGVGAAGTLSPGTAAGCAVVTTAPTAPTIALGTTDADTATVTGTDGIVPTGTLSFSVCGPDASAAACTPADGTAIGTPMTVTASGNPAAATATATSAAFAPTSTGTYCFVGVYSGAGIYSSASDSSTTDECFTVTAASPGVSTAPSQSAIMLGGSDTDFVTVTGTGGATPTGTVAFSVCGPENADATCTAADGTSLGAPVALSTTGGGGGGGADSPGTATATSETFTPTAPGIYCFVGVYSGDTNFNTAADGSAADECFNVAPAWPNVVTTAASDTISLGGSNSDSATVAGVDGITPTGSVDFIVCPWNVFLCTVSSPGEVDLGSAPLSAGATAGSSVASSASYTPTDPGNYCFRAIYTGDNNYDSAIGTDECFTVSPTSPFPLDIGSAENSFGTGGLSLDGNGDTSNIWAAVNGYCTSKENGDEFLSAFDATWNGDGWNCSADQTSETPNATTNYEYNGADGASAGYSYDIATPTSDSGLTTAPITLQAYDPAYEPTQCAGQSAGAFNPAGGQTPDLNAGGPDTSITTDYTLTYAPVPGNDGDDTAVAGVTGTYVAPSGDPTTCGQWATLFTLPTGSPDGHYRLQVTTPESPGQDSDGVNAYAVRVYQGASFARCSTVATSTFYSASCPSISAESALSTYVNEKSSSGSFDLARVPASYAGTTMDVNLFDPGEGDKNIQIVDPNGNVVPFTWQTTDSCPLPAPNSASTDCAQDLGFQPLSGSGTALDVSQTITAPPGEESNSEFNDREVQLAVHVPDDYTAPNGGWWQIEYTSTNGQVQDRATWSVVLGTTTSADPTPTKSTVLHESRGRGSVTTVRRTSKAPHAAKRSHRGSRRGTWNVNKGKRLFHAM